MQRFQTKNPPYLGSFLAIQNRPGILPDGEIREVFVVADHQALFVGQMQQADEAITCRNIRHLLLRIHCLQVVDDIGKLERAVVGFGRSRSRRLVLRQQR